MPDDVDQARPERGVLRETSLDPEQIQAVRAQHHASLDEHDLLALRLQEHVTKSLFDAAIGELIVVFRQRRPPGLAVGDELLFTLEYRPEDLVPDGVAAAFADDLVAETLLI